MRRPAARGPSTSRPHRRAFTLFELLISLVILAIISTMVALAWRTPVPASVDARAVIARARALAVRGAEPLRVEIRATGGWQIRSIVRDAVLAAGALNAEGEALAVDIDPLGTCQPVATGVRTDSAAIFDPLHCVWRSLPVEAL